MFDAFIGGDKRGGFGGINPEDIDGIIELYQASYLAFPDETMLDRARAFSIETLAQMMPLMVPKQREIVEGVLLDLPLHWGAPRLHAIRSLKRGRKNNSNDDNNYSINPSILELATVDFNLVQSVHRAELVKITMCVVDLEERVISWMFGWCI
jgi:hypothetical protein